MHNGLKSVATRCFIPPEFLNFHDCFIVVIATELGEIFGFEVIACFYQCYFKKKKEPLARLYFVGPDFNPVNN
jgi:hypothetical protein